MDVSLYGLTFSKFIQQFKETYKADGNTYDYMSLLKDIDYGSYCVLSSTYQNPNEVLNSQLTPLVNNITITGSSQQTGGMNAAAYLIIALMFIQTVSLVLAGPAQVKATETLLTDDPQKWREIMDKPTGEAPKPDTYRSKGFFYGFYQITEPQKAKFQEDFDSWKNNVDRQKIAAAAVGERNEEDRQKNIQLTGDVTTKLKTELSEASATENISELSLRLTESEQRTQFLLSKTLEENAELRKSSDMLIFLKGIGFTVVTGLIGFIILYRRQFARLFRRNNRPAYYQGQELDMYGQPQYPPIEDNGYMITNGGRIRKTRRINKKYKKRHTKRRR